MKPIQDHSRQKAHFRCIREALKYSAIPAAQGRAADISVCKPLIL